MTSVYGLSQQRGVSVEKLSKFVDVQTGIFGADMKVNILNDGPVTIILDSKELFTT